MENVRQIVMTTNIISQSSLKGYGNYLLRDRYVNDGNTAGLKSPLYPGFHKIHNLVGF